MRGEDNIGFEDAEKDSQVNKADDIELKEQTSTKEVFVKLENLKPETEVSKEKQLQNDNFIVKFILKLRTFFYSIFFGRSRGTKIFWIIFINGTVLGLLIASLKQANNQGSEIDWCNGVGFLWIVFALGYLGTFYSLTKRYFGKAIHNFFKPFINFCNTLTSKKYFRIFCYLAPIAGLAAYVALSPGKSGRRGFSFLGLVVFVIFGFIFSKYPSHIKWRPVISGLALQFAFGLMTIRWDPGKNVLDCLGNKVTSFLQYTEAGSSFVYGYLALPQEGEAPVFAFTVLPVVFFLSFFVSILSYFGILQWFILKISWVVKFGMGTTVCESVNAAASIFLGMTEAPLLIRSYLKDLTKSEICAILCAGWSTVAGVVLAAYIKFGVKASHLIAASIMSAPASLSFSKLFYPETEKSRNTVENLVLNKEEATNALDAASRGATAGIAIVAGIIANIIAFLAFIGFVDGSLQWIGNIINVQGLSFQFLMSKLFYPISFLMGVDEDSLEEVAFLVGIKTVANEFQAYQMLGELIKQNKLSERSEIIATYALCGFSNFGSIGITIGAMSSIEPRQTSTVTEVAITAFIAANIVCFLTACVAGCLIE